MRILALLANNLFVPCVQKEGRIFVHYFNKIYYRFISFFVLLCYNNKVIAYSSADDGYFILYSISKNHAWVRIPPSTLYGVVVTQLAERRKFTVPVVDDSLYVIIPLFDYYIRQCRLRLLRELQIL